jgi:hypothetical protein
MDEDERVDIEDELANAVAAAIADAHEDGLDIKQSIRVALCAVIDYGRLTCGEKFVTEMSEWALARKDQPLQPNS